jgi:hypothetical protein
LASIFWDAKHIFVGKVFAGAGIEKRLIAAAFEPERQACKQHLAIV